MDFITKAFDYTAVATSLLAFVALIVGALSSIKGLKRTSAEFDSLAVGKGGESAPGVSAGADQRPSRLPKEPPITFEVKALSTYYNRALSRATISFWFSLVFATIGFGVILFALLSHDPAAIEATIVKVISGVVIDGVSSLFFFQSTNAQRQMGDFFEKLRLDRLIADSRAMISEVENAERRDQLRAQLILKFAGIDQLLEGGPEARTGVTTNLTP